MRVWLGALLVFVIGYAVLLSAFAPDFFHVQPDETTMAWQAKLARDGYAPYRDYFAYKPPLAVYLPAALFATFGSSLAVLRVFSIVALAGTTVLLYVLCVRARMGIGWAGCAALMLPALLVPYWPVPSGQWVALGFGLAALLCVATPRPSRGAVFAAGIFAALAGLCVQTHGVLFAGLLAIRLLTDPATRGRHVLAAASAGIAAPLLVAIIALWYGGILWDAFQHVVLWPLQYYRQPGGFNDAPPQTARAGLAAIEWTPRVLLALLSLLFVTAVPSVASISAVLSWRRALQEPPVTFALLGCVLLWFVFSRGRLDQVHLIFLAPVFLYLLIQHVDWPGRGRGVSFMRVWLALAVLLMLRWPVHWLQEPPSLGAVRSVDAEWRARGLPTLIAELPGASASELPVLYLGQLGSGLYIEWSPLPPPVDWLQPPADRYNSPQEFQAIADFAQEHEIPYIVLQLQSAELWMRDASPIRDVLRAQYRRAFDTSWGTAYCRVGAAVPRTGEVICDLPPQ